MFRFVPSTFVSDDSTTAFQRSHRLEHVSNLHEKDSCYLRLDLPEMQSAVLITERSISLAGIASRNHSSWASA